MTTDTLTFPTGTVTFLFTDLEDSTRLWEAHPQVMKSILARHDQLVRQAMEENNGYIVKTTGDGFHVAFASAPDAVHAAHAAQASLQAESWEKDLPIRIRVGIHTGESEFRAGDYYGPTLNRAARIMGLGSGGQVLLSEITRSLVEDSLSNDITLEDLGKHSLKGIDEPLAVCQALFSGLLSDFPPLSEISQIPTNLPSQITEFVGRQHEIDELVKLVCEEHARLVTITAPGGTGKTRLSLEVARQVLPQFPDGVFLVTLAPLKSADQIVQTIIETLRITLASQGDQKDQLLKYFQNKTMLLVMDNFEHLLEGVGLMGEIVAAAPGVTILASSREKLNLHGEVVYEIMGLQFSEWKTVEEAKADSAGQLFIQSAQHTQPGFSLQPADLPALANICNRVQGIPLAILLAAAWVDMLPLSEIAAEIANSLDFLETDQSGIPDRHASIRAVFDYSWSLLDETEQELFKKLSLFRGGFTRQAAQAVAGASLRSLAKLDNKSLLVSNTATARYEVHELLRQYSQEKLEQDSQTLTDTQEKHASYYADFMAQAWQDLTYQRQKEALIEIVNDIDNIRAGWAYRCRQTHLEDLAKYIKALWFTYEIRGWYAAGKDLFADLEQRLRPLAGTELADTLLAQAIAAHGWGTMMLGDPITAEPMAEEAVELIYKWEQIEDSVIPFVCKGMALLFQNRTLEIQDTTERILPIVAETDSLWYQQLVGIFLSICKFYTGQGESAKTELYSSLQIGQDIGDYWGLTWIGNTLAQIARSENDLEAARKYYKIVMDGNQIIDFRRGQQYNYNNVGDLDLQLGLIEAAEQNYLYSLRISHEIGQVREMLSTLFDIATVRQSQEKFDKAVELLALVHKNPANTQTVHNRQQMVVEYVEELAEELKTQLPAEEYEAAWQRGQSLELEPVVKELLTALA